MNLKDLIALHKGGRSYATLARDCGGGLTAGRLQQMGTGALKEWPKPKALRALASGLHVTESVVVLAAAESLDLDTRRATGPLEDFLPAGVERLTEDQMRSIGALVHSIVKEQMEGGQSWGGNSGPEDGDDEAAKVLKSGVPAPSNPFDGGAGSGNVAQGRFGSGGKRERIVKDAQPVDEAARDEGE